MAFIGVARTSWLFARNVQEDTPEGEEATTSAAENPDTFSMLRMKNNLVSASKAGLSFSVQVSRIPSPDGEDIITPYVVWGNAINGSADDALNRSGRSGRSGQSKSESAKAEHRPDDTLQAALKWLEEELQDGNPHPSKPLKTDADDGFGIKPTTLERAYKELKGMKPFKVDGRYCWQLAPMNETPAKDKAESVNEEMYPPQPTLLVQVEGFA